MRSLNRIGVMLSLVLSIVCHSAIANDLAAVHWTPQPGTVSFTFDDGPSPVYTPKILDLLKKNDIKATFFVMGPLARKYPELINRMVAEGHAVGVHSMTHPKLTRLNDSELHYEVIGSRDILHKIIGKSPVCMSSPYGLDNKHVKKFVNAHDLILVPKRFNSLDYENRGVEQLTQRVINNAHSGQVFLFNDGYYKRDQTVAALPQIIAGIREKGLGFSAICYPD